VSGRFQHQRFEFKYHFNEAKARRIRDFLQAHLRLDEYSRARPDLSYPTLSLYLDSDGLDTYWHTIGGCKNRFKLRLRYYDDRPDTPVFFEIKHRIKDVIFKRRAGVRKDAVRCLLAGRAPAQAHLLDPDDAEAFAAVQSFCRLMAQLDAKPKLHVAYMREAYESENDNSVRLTFDRHVESQPHPTPQLIAKSPRPHLVFGRTVILELKFTGCYPKWFHEMVRTFDCWQEGAAKYAEGIYVKGENWVHRACSPERVLDEFLSAASYPGLFESLRSAAASASQQLVGASCNTSTQ
jgi:VTC domain